MTDTTSTTASSSTPVPEATPMAVPVPVPVAAEPAAPTVTVFKISSMPVATPERLYWRDGQGSATYGNLSVSLTTKPALTLSDEWEIIFYSLDGGCLAHSMTSLGEILWIPLTASDREAISAFVKGVTTPVVVPVAEAPAMPLPPATPVTPAP